MLVIFFGLLIGVICEVPRLESDTWIQQHHNPFGSWQNVRIKSRIFCNGQPAGNVTVWGVERDPRWNDYVNKTETDAEGKFDLLIRAKEWGKIEPYILIENNCNVYFDEKERLPSCWRYTSYDIPYKVVWTDGETPIMHDTTGKLHYELSFQESKEGLLCNKHLYPKISPQSCMCKWRGTTQVEQLEMQRDRKGV